MSLFDRVRDGNGSFPHAWSPTILLWLSIARIARTKLYAESYIRLLSNAIFVEIITNYCSTQNLLLQIIASRSALVHSLLLPQKFRSLAPHYFEFDCFAISTLRKICSGKALVRLVSVD